MSMDLTSQHCVLLRGKSQCLISSDYRTSAVLVLRDSTCLIDSDYRNMLFALCFSLQVRPF